MDVNPEHEQLVMSLQVFMDLLKNCLAVFVKMYLMLRCRQLENIDTRRPYSITGRIPRQMSYLRELVGTSDTTCLNNLRMPIHVFIRLCELLETLGGLGHTKHVTVHEQVAIFLRILSHHQKNRVIQTNFKRSGCTISRHFNNVLKALLKLHTLLLITPAPIPEDSNDFRWKHFKGCLGALDGTYVSVRVSAVDKAWYRNRKGEVSCNVLDVCDTNMNLIFVLSGWEGSAADSRVLRDAITRADGLKVPHGNYYLVDSGYTNGEGFLAPYRGVRYDLRDFGNGPLAPQNYKEFFNMKHAKARNVIERAFGILKSRWAILRSPSFYPIQQQNHILLACCLLHNFIRTNIDVDPEEQNVPEYVLSDEPDGVDGDFVETVECSQQWIDFRETTTLNMYNQWMNFQ